MQHQLVGDAEKAFGWSGAEQMGRGFVRGQLPDVGLCERLLTPHRLLDVIMRRALDQPQLRCLQAGVELHPSAFLTAGRTRRGQPICTANMVRLGRLLVEGVTVVLDTLDAFDPTMEVACRALQWWSHELVQVNTYLTTGSAAGFELHWDDHDVLVVQLAGEKSWHVRPASRVAPLYRDTATVFDPPPEVLWEGTTVAGDVLHIPRGFWHQATRDDRDDTAGYSLHVTFGFPQRTGVDWATWLADRARGQELFRRDLDRTDEQGTRAEAGQLAAALAQLATTSPPEQFRADRARTQLPARHVITGGMFGPPRDVVCVAAFPPEVTMADDATITVAAAGRRIRFAAVAMPVLTPLLSGQPVNIDDLAATTGINPRGVVEVLTQEEICAEVGPELSSGYTGLVPPAISSPTP